MSKLNLSAALAMKNSVGNINAIKGDGFTWSKPISGIADYYGIGPGQVPLALRLHDPATLTMDGSGYVSTVANAGGAGALFNLTAAAGQRPQWNGSQLVFDGADDFMTFDNSPDLNGTHFVAAIRRTGSTSQIVAGGSDANIWVYQTNETEARIRFTASGISHYPGYINWPLGTWVTFQHRLSEGRSTFWVNGVEFSSVEVTQVAAPIAYLGRGAHASLYRWSGSIGRIVSVITDTGYDRSNVEPAVTQAVNEVSEWVAAQ